MSTKAFRLQGRGLAVPRNSDGSTMLSYKDAAATRFNLTPQERLQGISLTPQERLQDLSLTHWHKPIDEALDVHLHSRLTFETTAEGTRTNTLARDSWAQWTVQYCKAIALLVPLVLAEEANERLTAVMADARRHQVVEALQPWMIRVVVGHVKDVKVQASSRSGGVGNGRGRGEMGQGPMRGHGSRSSMSGARDRHGGDGNRGGRGQGRRGKGGYDHTTARYNKALRELDDL